MRAILLVLACVAAAVLVSCASQPTTLPDGLSAAEVFQRAQDQVSVGNDAIAISFYEQVPQRFPDDTAHGAWASYEIAFLYHRMGQNAKALPLLKDLLDRYASAGDTLPPGPRILAQKLQARLTAAAAKTPSTGAAAGTAEAGSGS